jgi:formylglycine-generating enzyme required for sulfatase activity
MAGKIFINYRRDDSAPHALTVAQYLENTFGKRNIFIDIDRLRAGQKFERVLEDKLGQCKVMLVIIGPNWIDARDGQTRSRRLDNPDDWVRLEIERALARKIPVIPVLVAGAALPSKSDLPQTLRPLLDHQCATVTTNGFRHEMAGLARDVADLTVRRPWGRIAAAASAVILGGYAAAHEFGAPVWWPSFGLGEPNLLEGQSQPPAKGEAGGAAKSNADVAEAEAKRIAEAEAKRKAQAARDPALSVSPGSGKTFQDRLADGDPCPICPEMVVAPAGTFTMGSPPSEPDRRADEEQVRVTIAQPFAVGKFAVTFEQWDACVADGGCNGYRPADQGWGRRNRPVINVSWNDAKAFTEWLSRKSGKTYRLLSEAEREYVTRAGTTTPFWWGPSISVSQANYDGRYTYAGGPQGELRQRTVPVDNFEANRWGLFNVHGNVWEWTEDCLNDSNEGNPGNGSARAIGDCSRRVVRGGAWGNGPQVLRAAYRSWYSTDGRGSFLGFRLARTLQ